jgi:hypothetical protein
MALDYASREHIARGGGQSLNEYGRGAFEALSWVRRLIRKFSNVESVRAEVDVALDRLREGCAVEFGERVKFMRED